MKGLFPMSVKAAAELIGGDNAERDVVNKHTPSVLGHVTNEPVGCILLHVFKLVQICE